MFEFVSRVSTIHSTRKARTPRTSIAYLASPETPVIILKASTLGLPPCAKRNSMHEITVHATAPVVLECYLVLTGEARDEARAAR